MYNPERYYASWCKNHPDNSLSQKKYQRSDPEKGTAYFQTKEGIDDLVKGAYQKLKFKYNYIWGIYLYGMGIDEFTSGAYNILFVFMMYLYLESNV